MTLALIVGITKNVIGKTNNIIFMLTYWKNKTLGQKAIIIIVLALQALSWTTSVAGAKIILPNLYLLELGPIRIPAYILLGTIIQGLLLFLFFFGRQEIQSAWYRRTLLILLTGASIYTSFFIIYKFLSEDAKTGITFDKASEQARLYDSVANIVRESDIYKEKNDILVYVDDKIKERDSRKVEPVPSSNNPNATPKIRGEDPRNIIQTKEIETIEKLNTDLPSIRDIKKLVEKEQGTGDVSTAKKLLSSLTTEIKEDIDKKSTEKEKEILEKLKNEERYSDDYVLIPFQEVLDKNTNAILALCIASFIDIVSLIFGISLNKKSTDENINAKFKNLSRNIKELLKNSLPNLIKEIGHTIYLFIASFGSLINGILKGFILLRVRALQVFYYTPYTIKIKGDRHEFLHNIWESIEFSWEEDTKMNLLNYTKLMTLAQYNPSYRVGYKKIIITMRNLQWLTISEEYSSEDKKLSIKQYDKLDEWYHREYSKQLGPEKNSMLDADDYNHIIRLPENKGDRWWLIKQRNKLIFAVRQIFTG